jgi:hypothetical protein
MKVGLGIADWLVTAVVFAVKDAELGVAVQPERLETAISTEMEKINASLIIDRQTFSLVFTSYPPFCRLFLSLAWGAHDWLHFKSKNR